MNFKVVSNCVLLILMVSWVIRGQCHTTVFDVTRYGAIEGGNHDASEALLKAWNRACKWKGKSRVKIPHGTYLVKPIILTGPCEGPIDILNKGVLKAPLNLDGNSWIEFRYVNELSLYKGSYDGQGPPKEGDSQVPTLLRFSFVTNSKVQKLNLINSQNTHFHIFGCKNLNINKLTITSPGDSRNTDGIKIGESSHISISSSIIASGDDCIALLRGSNNIDISKVVCGPGHGISIGSMGGQDDEVVEKVRVSHCKLFNTTNGLRIKTKATGLTGMVKNIVYEDISFQNVDNPIIFDQHYCPSKTCSQGNSHVQISDIRFRNIHGTSLTKVGVSLQCSQSNPCHHIQMRDIDITYVKDGSKTIWKSSYASGQCFGANLPNPCL